MTHIVFILRPALKFEIRMGADKSLARLISRCCRTKSLEREVCSCAKLQGSSCYRGRKNISSYARYLKNMESRTFINFFFFARHCTDGNSRHSERNMRIKCNIMCHRWNLGCPVYTWFFSHLCCASSWKTLNSDHPGRYSSNWRADLGRLPDLG